MRTCTAPSGTVMVPWPWLASTQLAQKIVKRMYRIGYFDLVWHQIKENNPSIVTKCALSQNRCGCGKMRRGGESEVKPPGRLPCRWLLTLLRFEMAGGRYRRHPLPVMQGIFANKLEPR